MIKIEPKEIQTLKKFDKFGDVFEMIAANEEQHIWIFKRTRLSDGKVNCYEAVKGVPFKNSCGNKAYKYPSSEQFGPYGKCISGTDDYCSRRCYDLLNGMNWEPEDGSKAGFTRLW